MMDNFQLLLIGTMIFYTSIIILIINKCDRDIKDLNGSISDYKRAYSLSKDNSYSQQHYTQLQLENINLRSVISDLDNANKLLQQQMKQLKVSLVEPPLQYESSIYQNNLSSNSLWANQQELELDHDYIKKNKYEDGFFIEL